MRSRAVGEGGLGSRVCAHTPIALVLFATALAHGVRLGDVPSPAGDEGNWTSWALSLHRGEAVTLPAEASFVSLGYARAIALAFAAFGPSAATSRLPNAFAVLVVVAALYAAFARAGERRAGLFAALLVAVHPWTLAWGRCAAVPYALALACCVLGALAFVHGLVARREAALALGAAVVAGGAHFSPLAFVAAVAAGALTSLPAHRWALRSRGLALGVALGALVVFPLAKTSLAVASGVEPTARAVSFGGQVARFAHMVLAAFSGESTLRHFGSAALPVALAPLASLPALATAVASLRRAGDPPPPYLAALRSLGVSFALGALVLLPLLLAPARAWYLPDIDRERYSFVFLPGFALLVGFAGRRAAGRASVGLAGATLVMLALASLRLCADSLGGGGPDRGADVFAGGEAYRGFRVVRGARSPIPLVADAIERALPLHSGVVLADASLRPLGFELTRRASPPRNGHPRYFVAEAEYYPDPYTFTGTLAFVLHAPEAFATNVGGRTARARSEALRVRMHRDYADVRRLLLLVQANGRPLVEVWVGRRVASR